MNRFYQKISVLVCTALAALLSSCIYQDEELCPCDLHFVYDYNMEFADAFPAQVSYVKLHIFDESGRFVKGIEYNRSLNANERDVKLSLIQNGKEMLQPGTYKLVAWASDARIEPAYSLAQLAQQAAMDELTLDLPGTAITQQTYNGRLQDLWHAESTLTINANQPSSGTLRFTKDVKRFKILLQTAGSEPIKANDYEISIAAANYQYDCHNNPTSDLALTYLPYLLKETVIESEPTSDTRSLLSKTSTGKEVATRALTNSALLAELNTLRLMDDTTPQFVVRNVKSQKDVFRINLNKYLNLMRLDEYSSMPLQEYLDREDSYHVILLIGRDDSGAQVALSLQINAWRMIFNHTDL